MINKQKPRGVLELVLPVVATGIIAIICFAILSNPKTTEFADDISGIEANNYTIVIESVTRDKNSTTIKTIDDTTVTFPVRTTRNYELISGAQKDGVIQYTERKNNGNVQSRIINNYTH